MEAARNQDAVKPALAIERLLQFALQNRLIAPLDVYASRNALLDLFSIAEPYEGDVPEERLDSPAALLEELLDYAAETGLLPDNTLTHRDLLDARIMGLLMPRESEVANRFWQTAKQRSVEEATADFYKLSIDSHYIQMDRIRKNQYWLAPTEYGDLEITVNLSKPEKDPKEIALLKTAPSSNYPKCLLCIENVGYSGRLNHPARQNLRVIPLELNGEQWFFQYSPYVYYNEHCIVFHKEHVPMKTTADTFNRLLDFVDQFPHYFIGSNADLPIVGGSILNHDHFQGGRHVFPMEKAPVEASFSHPDYPNVEAGIVKWPMSVIRISGHNKQTLLKLASVILDEWKQYSDPDADIFAFTEQDGSRIPHNTITPIARSNAKGEYELDLVLRNNRTSAEHPDGIFHPHRELHHIKKENIGLIEVMGLAVLPGRLKTELEEIAKILTGELAVTAAVKEDSSHMLHKHLPWIESLISKYGSGLTADAAASAIRDEVGRKFLDVLKDAGVYKPTAQGQQAFIKFLNHLGFSK
jgi:UDPglucose--hexose-1-phosphate uridylyltransferase